MNEETEEEGKEREKIAWVKITPLESGYFVRVKLRNTTPVYKMEYSWKDLQRHAFEKYSDVEKYIRERIK